MEDESIAAQLMRVRDDKGNLLPHARQWSELSVFFYAGVSSTSVSHQSKLQLNNSLIYPNDCTLDV